MAYRDFRDELEQPTPGFRAQAPQRSLAPEEDGRHTLRPAPGAAPLVFTLALIVAVGIAIGGFTGDLLLALSLGGVLVAAIAPLLFAPARRN